MKINFKIVSLLVIICLLSLSAVSASDDNQTDVADLQATDDVDNIQIDDAEEQLADTATATGTYDELKSMITSASDGDTIDLQMDYDTGTVIVIDQKITIDGKNHKIDGKNSDRIFQIKTTGVTLQNIIFENGNKENGDSGGAILPMKDGNTKEYVSVTLINCSFINNKATYGGAFYTLAGGNTIINCTFEGNTATTGGAISINGDDNIIENTAFTNNKATNGNGGAIVFADDTSNKNNKIIGNTFTGNSAAGKDGGALYLQHGSADQIKDNTFTSNSAKQGGAVSLYETGYSTIINNTFTDNNATNIGGALRITITNSNSQTAIEGNTFKNNQAPNSGALHIDENNAKNEVNVKIDTNTFDNNKATGGYAGSIQINGNTVTIINNNFTYTSAKTNGGAIVVKTGTSKTIQSNNFINANAENGGAIHVESGAATIDSNNFTKCSATNRGGAIKADTKVTVTGNTFKDNSAKDKGSDVFIYNGDGSQVKNNDFINSTTNSLITYGNVVAQDNKGLKETLTISQLNKNYAATTTTKYLTVALKNSKGKGVAGKYLTISLNGKTYDGRTDSNGELKVKIAISAAKSYSCTVKFAGDDSNNAASSTFKLYVNKAATKLTAPAKTFKKAKAKKLVVTLKSGSKALAKKKVTLKIKGKKFSAYTNKRGKATIKIKFTKKGSFKASLKFAGDGTYKASSKTVKIKIK